MPLTKGLVYADLSELVRIDIRKFGCKEGQENTVALQSALDSGESLIIPPGNFLVEGELMVNQRANIAGVHPLLSVLTYKSSSTSLNSMFSIEDIDNIHFENFLLNCDNSDSSQNTIAFNLFGTDINNPTTEVFLNRVYLVNFQKYGILLNDFVYYFFANQCRILNTSNAVANGGTGSGNAVGFEVIGQCNIIDLDRCRFGGNDVAINASADDYRYNIGVRNSNFESNGQNAPSPSDTIALAKCNAVDFTGNYLEDNLTGATTGDAVLQLSDSRGVNIKANSFLCATGGSPQANTAIGIKNACYGVNVESNFFQDPDEYYIYQADGDHCAKAHRNHYDNAGTPVETYSNIVSKMTSLVEVDVPFIYSASTGSIAAGASYQNNLNIPKVPVDRNCTVLMTPQNGGADFVGSAAIIGADTVRMMLHNIDTSAHELTAVDFAFRVFKNGSF